MVVMFIVFLVSCVLVIGTPFTLHYLLYRTSLSECNVLGIVIPVYFIGAVVGTYALIHMEVFCNV